MRPDIAVLGAILLLVAMAWTVAALRELPQAVEAVMLFQPIE